jgi:hypothetical protein
VGCSVPYVYKRRLEVVWLTEARGCGATWTSRCRHLLPATDARAVGAPAGGPTARGQAGRGRPTEQPRLRPRMGPRYL